MFKYFKNVSGGVRSGNYNYVWKSKRVSNENITASATTDYSLN